MPAHLSSSKKILFWGIAVLVVLGFLELSAWITFEHFVPHRIKSRTAFRGPEDYIAAYKKARERRLASHERSSGTKETGNQSSLKMFHPVLGWDYPPGIEYEDAHGVWYRHGNQGERRTCTSYQTDLIATYGDSFAYSSDVGDCETWETYLARDIKANVLNFGVAGYGTDQAYLKYELNDARVSTPIVMLCILPDDINRIVNIFRTFYAPEDILALTKPLYRKKGGRFELVPNPLSRADDVAKLENREFVRKLGKLDYWYQKDMNRPPLRFPYLLSLIGWRDTVLKYEEAEPLSIMCHIVDLFVQTAQTRGSVPVIVLMPHRELVAETMRNQVSRVENLVTYLKARQYRFIDLIRVMAKMHPTEEQLDAWYHEHATPQGNRITARIISDYLERNALLRDDARRADSSRRNPRSRP
ncbi:MAG: hypothetical protein P8182_20555 [Deltaproteobacteria bacterium]